MEHKKLTGYPSIDKPWLKYYSEEARSESSMMSIILKRAFLRPLAACRKQ